jgi:hypothetical protein
MPGSLPDTLHAMNPTPVLETPAQARARLTQRLRELNEEIRAYPQPIARCDAQLGGLVEERAKLHAEIERLGPADG